MNVSNDINSPINNINELKKLSNTFLVFSTWTIDLAYLLCRFGIKHLYKTITIGVHPDLSSESFYRNVLNKVC